MDCVSRFRSVWLAALFAVFSVAPLFADEDQDNAAATVVVYNSTDPVSEKLASYYADQRKIPADHVIGLACPVTEEISRGQYETCIATPLKSEFLIRGWWKVETSPDGTRRLSDSSIRFVALIRGMPLKIAPAKTGLPDQPATRNEASVDSELACLDVVQWPINGPLSNPYYRRYIKIQNANMPPGLLLVCRLDGPTEESVTAMIDASLAAERDGLWGWGYIDIRSIKAAGYIEGDDWMKAAAAEMRKKGIPVLLDQAPEVLPPGYPVTDAAVYYGWYETNASGPFASPTLRFRPGAIAAHIHSYSAMTLRSVTDNWCGPLVARGAAITVGNVYEPYLAMTTNLDILQNRLMAGFTFAESAYMAIRVVSWMGVAIGDPLYRPYKVWQDLFGDDAPQTSWQIYRSIVLKNGGDVIAAGPQLADAAAKSGKSMFLEALGAAQADAGKPADALKSIDAAMAIESDPLIRFRLLLEKIAAFRSLGKKDEAGALVKSNAANAPGPAEAELLQKIYLQIYPPPTPAPKPKP